MQCAESNPVAPPESQSNAGTSPVALVASDNDEEDWSLDLGLAMVCWVLRPANICNEVSSRAVRLWAARECTYLRHHAELMNQSVLKFLVGMMLNLYLKNFHRAAYATMARALVLSFVQFFGCEEARCKLRSGSFQAQQLVTKICDVRSETGFANCLITLLDDFVAKDLEQRLDGLQMNALSNHVVAADVGHVALRHDECTTVKVAASQSKHGSVPEEQQRGAFDTSRPKPCTDAEILSPVMAVRTNEKSEDIRKTLAGQLEEQIARQNEEVRERKRALRHRPIPGFIAPPLQTPAVQTTVGSTTPSKKATKRQQRQKEREATKRRKEAEQQHAETQAFLRETSAAQKLVGETFTIAGQEPSTTQTVQQITKGCRRALRIAEKSPTGLAKEIATSMWVRQLRAPGRKQSAKWFT